MNILKKIFLGSKHPGLHLAKIDYQVYLLNYNSHYAPILDKYLTRRALAELYIFRAWTAQFGYRIFSSDPEFSDKLIGETVNSSKYLGLGVFYKTHGFNVEEELRGDYMSLIEDRWQHYDVIVSASSGEGSLPAAQIIFALAEKLNIWDAEVAKRLARDFLTQLDFCKRTAIEIGLLRL